MTAASTTVSPFSTWAEDEPQKSVVDALLAGWKGGQDGFGPESDYPNTFLCSLASQVDRKRMLSHAQVMAARATLEGRGMAIRMAAQRKERFKGVRKAKIKAGEQVIEGEVIGTPKRGTSVRLHIETGKNRVFGYCPQALRWMPTEDGEDVREVAVGDLVKFTAVVTPHAEDPYFGFFKKVSEVEYQGRVSLEEGSE